MKLKTQKNGFTLVELMVSVGITAILMLGISTFFSSTFRNMFTEREKVTNTQEEFVVNTILGGKFVNVDKIEESTSGYVVLRNDMETGDLPFTYIGYLPGPAAPGKIVFKDFFVYNGRDGSVESFGADVVNPGGIEILDDKYFITAPLEDKIYVCATKNNCGDTIDLTGLETPLDQPMDITSDNNDTLYITDAGNDRVLEIIKPGEGGQEVNIIASGLNYPTGIEFYAKAGNEYLFIADTYHHLVKKIRLPGGSVEVVVGEGDDEDCDPDVDDRDHTALFCKLNFPTGVMIANDGTADSLYIADTGNDRVLRVWDPGPPASEGSYERITFSFGGEYALEKVGLEDFENELLEASTMIDGLNATYNDTTHEMNLGSLFTAYDNPGPPCNWSLGGTYLYIANPDISILEVGDIISVEGNTYEILAKTANRLVCQEDESIVDRAHRLTLDSSLVGVNYGSNIYFASVDQNEENIDLVFGPDSFAVSGFDAIDIEVYEFGNSSPVETHRHVIRIGDGELGTFEDTIEVVDYVYDFPTGLGWDDDVLNVSSPPSYSVDFDNYDYVSDFDVQGFGISTLNDGDVLEITFEAKIGEDAEENPIWEENTLSANVKE